MTTLNELLGLHDRLTTMHVERWVARGLLRAAGGADAWSFEQIDVARARLLAELADDIGFDDDTVETVIGLVERVGRRRGGLSLGVRHSRGVSWSSDSGLPARSWLMSAQDARGPED